MNALRRLSELPLATLAGAGLGVLVALVGAALALGPLEDAPRPLAIFALAPLPAIVGAWVDWARLWRPTARVRRASALALVAAIWLGTVGALEGGLPLAGPLALGAAALLALALRPTSLATRLGWRTVEGRIRRDESERVVLDTPDGVVDLGRENAALGTHRELDLAPGRTLAVVARLRSATPDGDPFRSERRSLARDVLAVAATTPGIEAAAARRARAWGGYLLGLALLAAALTAGLGYSAADPSPPPRGVLATR